MAHQLRYALRLLWKSPAFTVIATVTLALGIGANTAIFSLVNAVLLRPLPFPDQDRLVLVWEDTKMFNLRDSPVALGNYTDWKQRNRVFDEMGALEGATFRLTGDGEPEQVSGSNVTSSLFRTLRVNAMLGRTFLDMEEQPGAPKTVVLSYGLWQRRFGGDRNIVGRSVLMNMEKFTVVGVMPPGFRFPDSDNELWAPVGTTYSRREFTNHGRHDWMAVARLKPGATLQRASEDIKAIAAQLGRDYPLSNAHVGAFVAPLRDHFVGSVRNVMWVLLAAVAFVLLIACANVANLLLARTADRKKEMAVRAALGAGRGQIASQLVAESLLLALLGGVSGTLVAIWTFRALAPLVPTGISAMVPLTIDYGVLAFALALSLITGLLFGMAPLLDVFRIDVQETLKQAGGRTAGTGPSGNRFRGALLICEVASSIVLLIGAALMIQTFARLRGVDPGFRTDHLLTLKTPLSFATYKEPAKRDAFYQEVLRRVTALPGVVSAGYTTGIPIGFKGWFNGVTLEGHAPTENLTANYRQVTSDYLRTIGFRLLEGRYLNESDNAKAPRVAVINQTMARTFWPNQDALGKRFNFGIGEPLIAVAGIVADIHGSGLDVAPRPEMYLPSPQTPTAAFDLAIRTTVNPLSLAPAVRREIRAVDKDQPIIALRTMDDVLDKEVFERRFQMLLLSSFAGLALLLAVIGIYGVISNAVAQRTQDIGIRMALGARPADILKNIIGYALTLSLAGVAIGVGLALAITRVMSSLLFHVSATDPLTFVGVSALLLAVALAATYIPAQRAMRVDPITALRNE